MPTSSPKQLLSPGLRRKLFLGRSLSFLLSQVGAHSSRMWNQRLTALNLDSREVMLLWNVALAEGLSQREVAKAIGLPDSRVVGLLDALEERGWLERRMNANDRRARALYPTKRGRETLEKIIAVAADHESLLGQGLNLTERRTLVRLLARVAIAQSLERGVHPDF